MNLKHVGNMLACCLVSGGLATAMVFMLQHETIALRVVAERKSPQLW